MKDIRGEYRKLIDIERELIHKLKIVRQCMKDHAKGEVKKIKRNYVKPYKKVK
jgi:NADH:ubiquinone oxidoreductase subunit D